jgi:hypothetical protein
MESNSILAAISNLEEYVSARLNAFDAKFLTVSARPDTLDVNVHHLHSKFDNFGENSNKLTPS